MRTIKTIHKSLVAGLAFLLFGTSFTWGQNMEEDTDYQQLLALQAQAQAEQTDGNYDKAYQLSQEGSQTGSLLYERFLARRALKEAGKKLALTKSYKADVSYPELYNQANDDYKSATAAYDKQEYPTTIELSEKIMAALDKILPELIAAAQKAKSEHVFPKYYKVRLILQDRDCFWKIAAYPFIYNNGLFWKRLYEANKHKIPDINNPDLITPGLLFEIPSLKGEKREGTYDPQQTYPAFRLH